MESIAATGGGAASELTLQIRADVFNMEVSSMECDEAGTLGCMVMAATAAGAYPSLEDGIRRAIRTKRVYRPDAAMHAWYMEKFDRYRQLYERMFDFK